MVPGGAVVKNPPTNAGVPGKANPVHALKDPLEKEMATHSSILAWEIPWTGAWRVIVHGATKSQTKLSMRIHTES